ncbi:MAG: hypothetical protein PHH75_00340 [Candidatus Omnitrophica bacterium]|nr:hypothetical protein [Candidatus Omnitrophota bacterium]MDD5573614.1 hypothetical protein [Candidatus Omnitrophota bacterium]
MKILKGIISFFCLFAFCDGVLAQSTLEYTTLTGGMAAAAKAGRQKARVSNEEEAAGSGGDASGIVGEAMTQLYSESGQALASKGPRFLSQVGSGPAAQNAVSGTGEEAGPSSGAKVITFEEDAAGTGPDEAQGDEAAVSGQKVRVHFKSGPVIEGRLVEERENDVRVESEGIILTYFKEEIAKVEKF